MSDVVFTLPSEATTRYHTQEDCRHVTAEAKTIPIADALERGYEGCRRCTGGVEDARGEPWRFICPAHGRRLRVNSQRCVCPHPDEWHTVAVALDLAREKQPVVVVPEDGEGVEPGERGDGAPVMPRVRV